MLSEFLLTLEKVRKIKRKSRFLLKSFRGTAHEHVDSPLKGILISDQWLLMDSHKVFSLGKQPVIMFSSFLMLFLSGEKLQYCRLNLY